MKDNFIDFIMDTLTILPYVLVENNKHKSIRLLMLFLTIPWFVVIMPVVFIGLFIYFTWDIIDTA